MWMLELLFKMEGRIGRRDWWIGSVASFVVAMAFYFVAMRIMGQSERVAGVMGLVFIYPSLALMLKRFADLDWPRWPAYAFAAVVAVLQVLPTPDPAANAAAFGVFTVIVLAGTVAEIVTCGCLRGKAPEELKCVGSGLQHA
jgi:uncharacterized membrane protein YhaH (DUF805 family)